MKPFNLAEALAGKPVVTRDGRKAVRVIHVPELIAGRFKVLAIVDGWMVYVEESGRYCPNGDSPNDLFMASKKKRGWVNVYSNPAGVVTGIDIHDTEEMARSYSSGRLRYIATVPIEWEE